MVLSFTNEHLLKGERDMTTPEMVRCRYCFYLVEDEDGNWVCDDCQKEIHEIPDDECSAEQEW